tara:strand:+ start:127 stop:534 length:408 start_codon:yes stop_codon:yes gene_type:complete
MIVAMKITGQIADGIQAVPDNLPNGGQKFLEVEVDFNGTIKKLKEAICEELPGDNVQPDDINLGRINHLPDNAILNNNGLDGNYIWSKIIITGQTAYGGGKRKKIRKTKKRRSKKRRGKSKKRKSKRKKTRRRRR